MKEKREEGSSSIMSDIPESSLLLREHCIRLRFIELVDNDTCTWPHCWGQASQDLNAVRIRPIVKGEAEEVDGGVSDRLLGEEVVRHELHPVFELLWEALSAFLDNIWKILHNNSQVRECLSQRNGHSSLAPANVDDCRFSQ